MRPAFTSRSDALLFSLLVAALILLPCLDAAIGFFSRVNRYTSIPLNIVQSVEYIKRQIFDVRSDIDIAFVGSSTLWVGIDAPYVQAALSQKLGRPAVVTSLAYQFEGQDMGYLMEKDLLQHRHVHMFVTVMPFDTQFSPYPHHQIFRLFQFDHDAEIFADANPAQKLALFSGAILGTPRELVGNLRPDRISDSSFFDQNLGGVKMDAADVPYEVFHPVPPQIDPRSMIYSEATKSRFAVEGRPVNPYQRKIAQRAFTTALESGAKFVILNFPWYKNRRSPASIERMPWREELGPSATLVGVPPAELFAHLSDAEIFKLYYQNGTHFNRNGNEFFTRVITPALLEAYGDGR